MFKRIVVAIDGSKHSYRTLEYAKQLAGQPDAVIWLVHAFPHTSDLLGYDEYEKLIARREGRGQKILDEARRILGETEGEVWEELLEGPPAEAILNVAKARRADLIIVGSRGNSTFKELLVGSVSHKVLHHAPCPVMLVR